MGDLNLGAFGRGVPGGSLGRTLSISSAQCARRAHAVRAQCKDSPFVKAAVGVVFVKFSAFTLVFAGGGGYMGVAAFH